MFETGYSAKLKDKIELANLLAGLSDKDTEIVYSLYLKKKDIMNKNSFLATFKINKINKQINKIRSKYSEEDIEKYKNSQNTNSIFEQNQNNDKKQ